MKFIPFPTDLKSQLHSQSYAFKSKSLTWFHPTTLQHVSDLKHAYPQAKLINGNTEVGIEVKFKHTDYAIAINTRDVKSLGEIVEGNGGISVGACVDLSTLKGFLELFCERKENHGKMSGMNGKIAKSVIHSSAIGES